MKTIPFEKAFELLQKAHDVVVLDTPCTMRSCTVNNPDPDDPDHCFLELEADDSDDYIYNWNFQEADNATVKIEGDVMTLVCLGDEHNETAPIRLQLLAPMQLESLC